MLRFIQNNSGIMGLTLSQIGLIIATGIILVAVISFIFNSDWQRNAELHAIADHFSTLVEGMDTRYFENVTSYRFPEKSYSYIATLSTEYLVLTAPGNLNNIISIKERFIIRPLPLNQTLNADWVTGEELHGYLHDNYGHNGTELDPIAADDVSSVQSDINTRRDSLNITLASSPLALKTNKTAHIEKVIIYYDVNGGGWEKEDDTKQDFILIYQDE